MLKREKHSGTWRNKTPPKVTNISTIRLAEPVRIKLWHIIVTIILFGLWIKLVA